MLVKRSHAMAQGKRTFAVQRRRQRDVRSMRAAWVFKEQTVWVRMYMFRDDICQVQKSTFWNGGSRESRLNLRWRSVRRRARRCTERLGVAKPRAAGATACASESRRGADLFVPGIIEADVMDFGRGHRYLARASVTSPAATSRMPHQPATLSFSCKSAVAITATRTTLSLSTAATREASPALSARK